MTFKVINDKYGHRAGDEALIQIAISCVQYLTGLSAFLARYGGDEVLWSLFRMVMRVLL